MYRLALFGAVALAAACSEYTVSRKVGSPSIVLDPGRIEFAPGDPPNARFEIRNVGQAALDVEEIRLDGGAFSLEALEAVELAPDETLVGNVRFEGGPGTALGVVTVTSNDPLRPVVELPLQGTSDEGDPLDPDAPTAVCGVDPPVVQAIHESATFSGAGSTAPDGGPLAYAWALVSGPPGSAVALEPGGLDDPDRTFTPDLVGLYTAELTVSTEGGATAQCTAVLEAVPATELWVEMFWDRRGDDMDLHLVRAGGELFTSEDCYFLNCTRNGLEWGPPGAPGDPRLDLDDIPGTGPENINVDEPEEAFYHVWVNDYPSGPGQNDANDVTVRIYLSGHLAFEETRALSGEDHSEYFARVDWATGSVDPR